MSCGFQSYLIAASPPGFQLLSYNKFQYDHPKIQIPDKPSQSSSKKSSSRFPSLNKNTSLSNSSVTETHEHNKEFPLQDTRLNSSRNREKDLQRITEWDSAYKCLASCCADTSKEDLSKQTSSKKLRFADEDGGELFKIKIASEPSDVPPSLSLNHILQDDPKDEEIATSHLNSDDADTKSTIEILNFRLPTPSEARMRMKANICLEYISCNDGAVIGRIITKNFLSEKVVYLRYTTDNWSSITDSNCKQETSAYVVNVYGYDYEMYTFEINFEKCEKPIAIELALCYVVDDLEYWDNNEGDNYKFIFKDMDSHSGSLKPIVDLHEQNFIGECMFGNDLPYW